MSPQSRFDIVPESAAPPTQSTPVDLAIREEIDQAIKDVLSGRMEAFGRVIELTERSVRFTIAAVLPDAACLEDVAEDVYIKIYRQLGDYTLGTNFLAWIRAYARNAALNERKQWLRRQRMASLDDDAFDEPEVDPLGLLNAPASDVSVYIMELIEELPETHREVIQLFYFEQHSTREIAHKINKSDAAVRVLLHRARRTLAQEYKLLTETAPSE